MSTQLTTITRTFQGVPLHFIEREDAVWLTADELGRALGYAGDRAGDYARRLADRHADEVARFRSRVKLTREAGTREVVIFAEPAIYLLACHAETERAAAFRSWLAETLHDLRTKDKVLVNREDWERQQDLAQSLLTAYESQAAAASSMASAAGAILRLRRLSKPKDDPRQLLLDGVRFEELPELSDGEGAE